MVSASFTSPGTLRVALTNPRQRSERRAGIGRRLRRGVAVLLVLVIALFLAASGGDHCDEGMSHHAEKPPHMLCVDDCAPAVIPAPPAPPPSDPLPNPTYQEVVARPVLSLDLEPEKAPPRA